MSKPGDEEIKSNIQAEDAKVWNQADQRPDGLDLFEGDLAVAIAKTWSDIEDAFVISSVPVSGGSSNPGGHLENGDATLSAGMLTNNESFTAIIDNFSTSFPDGATEGLLALVEAISSGIGQNFPLWVKGFSATLVASGGTCAWSTGPPPTSGPWSGGEVEDFMINNGSSTGDSAMTVNSLYQTISDVAEPLKQYQNKLQPALSALITAVVKGFVTTWNQWKSKTKISGGKGTGTASPPNGSVVGVVTSPKVG